MTPTLPTRRALPAQAVSERTATEAAGIGCEAPPSDNRKVPADLRWEFPRKRRHLAGIGHRGPTKATDEFASCFEHSPVGAALAAVAINFSTTDRTQLDVAEFYLADSPGRDYVLANTCTGCDSPSALTDLAGKRHSRSSASSVEQYDGERARSASSSEFTWQRHGHGGFPLPDGLGDGDWKSSRSTPGSPVRPPTERNGVLTDGRRSVMADDCSNPIDAIGCGVSNLVGGELEKFAKDVLAGANDLWNGFFTSWIGRV